uniref:Uncharacterized protein n=1 Tax=Mycena chlorophos TaxID=658473 RepID=A0ABQ0LL99_MYCCL|nr:predicted protein [Mycena chlorophos]
MCLRGRAPAASKTWSFPSSLSIHSLFRQRLPTCTSYDPALPTLAVTSRWQGRKGAARKVGPIHGHRFQRVLAPSAASPRLSRAPKRLPASLGDKRSPGNTNEHPRSILLSPCRGPRPPIFTNASLGAHNRVLEHRICRRTLLSTSVKRGDPGAVVGTLGSLSQPRPFPPTPLALPNTPTPSSLDEGTSTRRWPSRGILHCRRASFDEEGLRMVSAPPPFSVPLGCARILVRLHPRRAALQRHDAVASLRLQGMASCQRCSLSMRSVWSRTIQAPSYSRSTVEHPTSFQLHLRYGKTLDVWVPVPGLVRGGAACVGIGSGPSRVVCGAILVSLRTLERPIGRVFEGPLFLQQSSAMSSAASPSWNRRCATTSSGSPPHSPCSLLFAIVRAGCDPGERIHRQRGHVIRSHTSLAVFGASS